jgi:exosortase A-associated hydrolase 1
VNYTEQAVTFNCAGESLVGVLAAPNATVGTICSTGLVVIVGGPQYRAGSHRQFVLLARALAAGGYPVLRFDYRGMGDSSGALHDFNDVSSDIGAAIDAMQRHLPSVTKVALWGLCDGASAALLYCDETHDERVSGLCLLNPWVRSEASLARTQVKHYYLQRIMQKDFWAKLMRGGVAWNALAGLARNIAVAATGTAAAGATISKSNPSSSNNQPFQQRMAAAWGTFNGSILLLLSGDDYTAKEFLEYAGADSRWKNAFAHPRLIRHDLPGADHTFSNAASQRVAEDLCNRWLGSQADRSRNDHA